MRERGIAAGRLKLTTICTVCKAAFLKEIAVLLVHAVMAMDLVLFVGMTKLAHAVYRPLALFAHFARQGGGNA